MPQLESSADVQYQYQLPTVSYHVINDDPSLLAPAGVHSESLRHYGYNDFSDFNRPEHYIRHIEPIESELAVQVEYDMDEQDQAWLETVNAERKKDQSGAITYEVFEIIMDKLEKEWFNLIKRIPQPASHMPVEDSKCAVCDDGEGENSNAIVFCDGCNLAVHQDCYGVPYIPEGQWLCRKCTVSPENPVSCLVCPNEGGAFKQTTSGHWAHLLCAIWIPELTLGNAIYMEPIDGVEAIPKNRWRLVCSLCRERMGACVQCDNRNCFTAFHVTCARQMGYLMAMKSVHNDGSLKAFCDKHLPDEMRKDTTFEDDFDSEAETPIPKNRRTSHNGQNGGGGGATGVVVTTKTARAHAKSYRPGPPVVPHLIVQLLLDYVAKLAIRKKAGFVEKLCRYWSLKREARRGAPLLKRLHLEPWTASNAGRQQTEAEKALKLSFLRLLRNDLEKVRMLAEQVRKREREKLRQAQVIKDVVDSFVFPAYEQLRLTLEKISAMDRSEIFLHPVNRHEVPDYFDVIKEPMSWLQIDEKLEKNMYRNTSEFKHDVELVLDNAMLYNRSDSAFHKTAKRIKSNITPLLLELDSIGYESTLLIPNDEPNPSLIPEGSIGNLEPSLLRLQTLLQASTISNNDNTDNLSSLFDFEITKPREPTPPPPPPPPPKPKIIKPKKSDKEKWEERDAARKDRIIARSTRSVVHANSAFAQEVGFVSSDTEAHSRQSSRGGGEGGEVGRTTRNGGRSSRLNPTLPPSSSTTGTGTGTGTGTPGDNSSSSRMRKLQTGVVAVELVPMISDRERRDAERALDLVIDEVDGQDQFKRFNVGWVLPAGSKRKRAERPDSLGVPRARTNTTSPLPSTSKLPDNAALPPPPSSPLSTISSSNLSQPDNEDELSKTPKLRNRIAASQVNAEAGPSTLSVPTKKRRAADYPPSFGRGKRRRRGSPDIPTTTDDTITIDDEEKVSGTIEAVPEDELAVEEEPEKAGEEVMEVDKGNDGEEEMTPVPPSTTATPNRKGKGRAKGKGKKRVSRAQALTTAGSGEDSLTPIPDTAALPTPNTSPPPPSPSPPVKSNKRSGRASRGRPHSPEVVLRATQEKVDVPASTSKSSRKSTGKRTQEKIEVPASTSKNSRKSMSGGGDRRSSRMKAKTPEIIEVDDDDDEEEEEEVAKSPSAEIIAEGDEEDDPYPVSTLVWAKMPGFPYFPSEIIDPYDEEVEIPDVVLDLQPDDDDDENEEGGGGGRHWLVRFFDTTRSYAWVKEDKLDMLGESDEIDMMYLAGKEKIRTKGFKNASEKRGCRKAYREAMAQVAADGEEE